MEEIRLSVSRSTMDKRRDNYLVLNINKDVTNESPKLYRAEKVYSPVTDLAMNLGGLSTISHINDETPKRKLSLCSTGSGLRPVTLMNRHPSFTKQVSQDEGCYVDSPSPVEPESSDFQKRFGQINTKSGKSSKYSGTPKDVPPSAAFRRFQSMPVPFSGFDPTPPTSRQDTRLSDQLYDSSPIKIATPKTSNLFSPDVSSASKAIDCSFGTSPLLSKNFSIDDDDNSQDSGVCMDKGDSKDSAEFKCPLAPVPRRNRNNSDSNSSPQKSSSCKAEAPLTFSANLFKDSPVQLTATKLTYSPCNDESDDGFLDILDMDNVDKENAVPKGMEKLFCAPVLSKQQDLDSSMLTPSLLRNPTLSDVTNKSGRSGSFRRGLFRSPSAPKLSKAQSFCVQRVSKRSEPCSEEDSTPRVSKRRKSVIDQEDKENNVRFSFDNKPNRPKLQRCQSDTEAIVKAAMERFDNRQLIGDMSKEYALPLVKGKHQDLKSITPDTVADLINGEYRHVVEKFVIIDCRYPYEYDGGHIQGAKNMYTRDEIYDEFLKSANKMPHTTEDGKRNILIFHCEFSSERAPKLSRFLRSQDRDLNKDTYPGLHYPEIYLLDQGYKNFFNSHIELCTPQSYMTMLDENHCEDLRKFRAKSKSWSGDRKAGKGRISVRSGLKF